MAGPIVCELATLFLAQNKNKSKYEVEGWLFDTNPRVMLHAKP